MPDVRAVVIATVRLNGTDFPLAVPAARVRRVQPRPEDDEASVEPWPGLPVTAAQAAPWILILNHTTPRRWPVWHVEPPQTITRAHVHPVPPILNYWARRLQVAAFVSLEDRLIPLVLPETNDQPDNPSGGGVTP